MRFMMFMIPNISEDDWMPDPEAVAAMTKYNEELTKAGVLLALDGLHPTTNGARVAFPGGKAKVTDGPFSRGERGDRWLLADRREVQGRGRRMGQASAVCRRAGHRGPSGLRDRGLPSRGSASGRPVDGG